MEMVRIVSWIRKNSCAVNNHIFLCLTSVPISWNASLLFTWRFLKTLFGGGWFRHSQKHCICWDPAWVPTPCVAPSILPPVGLVCLYDRTSTLCYLVEVETEDKTWLYNKNAMRMRHNISTVHVYVNVLFQLFQVSITHCPTIHDT